MALPPIIVNVTVPGFDQLVRLVTNLPSTIFDFFLNAIVLGLKASLQNLLDMSFQFLFSSPNPTWFCAPYNTVMAILESLFSIALMGLALMFIIRSNDVQGRLEAKKWLENLLMLIVVLSFSFALFQLIVGFNDFLATSFANQSMKNVFSSPYAPVASIFMLTMLFFNVSLLALTFVTLLVRYLLIPFLLLLFPVAIFLYFLPPTRDWGKTGLKIILSIVFMTALDALILLGLTSLFGTSDPNLADAQIKMFAFFFGFGIIGVINVLVLLKSILSVVKQSKTVMSIVGLATLGKVLAR